MPTTIPVLMYHALEDAEHPAGAKEPGEQLYVLQVKQFREQMEYLHREGFQTVLLDELYSMSEWPVKAIVLTFDDGHESNYTLAVPILKEFGFKAEFFITTDWIGTEHFLTRKQVIEILKAGMSIGSHGTSHSYLNDLSDSDIEKELDESKKVLENILDKKITSFSAPGGRTNLLVISIVKKVGYHFLCTSKIGFLTNNNSTFNIPRFSIKNNTTMNNFIKITRSNYILYIKIYILTLIFNLSKKILHNNVYEIIRKFLLKNDN